MDLAKHEKRIKKFEAFAKECAALARTYKRHAFWGWVWGVFLIAWSIFSIVVRPGWGVGIWAITACAVGVNSFRNARRDKTQCRNVRADGLYYLNEIEAIKEHVASMAVSQKAHEAQMAAMDKEFINELETQTAMLQKEHAGKPH